MNKLITFAKGKLTLSSIIAYLLTLRLDEMQEVFNVATERPVDIIQIVAVAGSVWGLIRKNLAEYKEA